MPRFRTYDLVDRLGDRQTQNARLHQLQRDWEHRVTGKNSLVELFWRMFSDDPLTSSRLAGDSGGCRENSNPTPSWQWDWVQKRTRAKAKAARGKAGLVWFLFKLRRGAKDCRGGSNSPTAPLKSTTTTTNLSACPCHAIAGLSILLHTSVDYGIHTPEKTIYRRICFLLAVVKSIRGWERLIEPLVYRSIGSVGW
jgi:hypothetical protein